MSERCPPDPGWERETLRAGDAPLLVVLNPTSQLLARCRDAAAASGAVAISADLAGLKDVCHARRPAALVLTRSVYTFDPEGFFAIARDAGARLIQLPDDRLPREALIAAFQRVLVTMA